ncbi:DNA-directed RNA polymerase subunit omega [Gehongia tenuis]|jgi:DNA-directed RNA polymerase subunit omega|uniref:DNA-directed RNA polymerase subunit omega n=1 Tax=Gehongia tenuis TaxID=2763655 RepID=A0A926D3B2_9FIRM|nr:DNA-directed RNA polymerase subunit omega [Gehongia tenuis]MBC8530761.1 DNA-directed RNA polymerase subunit omega [Gehongia tenuis]
MINHPPLTELMDMVDCRYTLVVETAKRARQLVDQEERAEEFEDAPQKHEVKAVSQAVEEIYEGKVTYQRVRDGIK